MISDDSTMPRKFASSIDWTITQPTIKFGGTSVIQKLQTLKKWVEILLSTGKALALITPI